MSKKVKVFCLISFDFTANGDRKVSGERGKVITVDEDIAKKLVGSDQARYAAEKQADESLKKAPETK